MNAEAGKEELKTLASAIRRVMAFLREYREHLLDDLCVGLKRLPDDRALADTLEQLDHLSCELLIRLEGRCYSSSAALP